MDWCQGIDEPISKLFDKEGIEYKTFYMDTKRKGSKAWKEKSAKAAQAVLEGFKPDVVITVDDNAQAFFAKKLVAGNQIQIVFNGVNADPEKYGFPAENASGILERTYADQSLGLLQQIIPGLSKVAYMADDSATASLVTPRIQAQANSGKLPVEVVGWERPATFSQWQQVAQKYNADSTVDAFLIPLYHTVKKEDGTTMKPSDVMAWTVANTGKPIIGLWPFSTNDGALCAVVVDPSEHGQVAAQMAVKIANGKKAGDLPVVVNKQGYVIINAKTAQKLGVQVPYEVIASANKVIE
jgi:ABC-type uncharacterized transport system substrate-binding protein